ncbi:MAG TPA: alternative ribosome rescue aminoacyl-tRNA hydrolase ArfB [Polyangium sp.]|nr:alternative ribosome rescue aminoacyl-tRNA hydrolase ArfB [Polyangium sp.]
MSNRNPPPSGIAIVVTDEVCIPETALTMTAVRASGPGGQNVNKVASKVDMRVDLSAITGLDAGARARLSLAVASRLDAEGMLRITSQKTRDQAKNILDAYEKIRQLVAAALVVPKPRKPTRPSRGAVEKRLGEKKQTAERKKQRTRRLEE